ncbi:hypothetical protein OBBRIDRAFT_506613 [Obba rivulosa]|uniref:Uncharacterized protein n=1 Tax=Obba rivulosa TaxID=1052685 RepID=A0A8E2AVN5_9APHY|nr:hypothetical protein OBBRIDRAFT_506613 [Obba rivulosa]
MTSFKGPRMTVPIQVASNVREPSGTCAATQSCGCLSVKLWLRLLWSRSCASCRQDMRVAPLYQFAGLSDWPGVVQHSRRRFCPYLFIAILHTVMRIITLLLGCGAETPLRVWRRADCQRAVQSSPMLCICDASAADSHIASA